MIHRDTYYIYVFNCTTVSHCTLEKSHSDKIEHQVLYEYRCFSFITKNILFYGRIEFGFPGVAGKNSIDIYISSFLSPRQSLPSVYF